MGAAFPSLDVPPLGQVELVAWLMRRAQTVTTTTPPALASASAAGSEAQPWACTWAAVMRVEFFVHGAGTTTATAAAHASEERHHPHHLHSPLLAIRTPMVGASLRPPVSVHLHVDLDPAAHPHDLVRARLSAELGEWSVCYAAVNRRHCIQLEAGGELPNPKLKSTSEWGAIGSPELQ